MHSVVAVSESTRYTQLFCGLELLQFVDYALESAPEGYDAPLLERQRPARSDRLGVELVGSMPGRANYLGDIGEDASPECTDRFASDRVQTACIERVAFPKEGARGARRMRGRLTCLR